MKAIAYSEFGPPEVLKLAELPKPTPKEREVLVKVRAAAVNPLDWHFVRGEPSMMRVMGKPKNRVPGVDVAGQIEEVGPKVTLLSPGDEVFGACTAACAEYACGSEISFVRKPARITFEQAAGIPVAACTALMALRDHGNLEAKQSVLINGAAGGIGTFAVQIATAFGAEVTGVCSTRNIELVRSLGAAHVVDYTAEDFTQGAARYDLILHIAGNRTVRELKRALAPGGTLVVVGTGAGRGEKGGRNADLLPLLAQVFKQPFMRFMRQRVLYFVAKTRRSDLAFLAELIEAGKVTPVVDRAYPLAETAEAIRHLETGHARGKIIVTV
jgi:NADPH:quinone reductase-like Zn-dependent oxidoreductase